MKSLYDELYENGEVVRCEAEVHASSQGVRIYDVNVEIEFRAPSLGGAGIIGEYSFNPNITASSRFSKDTRTLPQWVVANAFDSAILKEARIIGCEEVVLGVTQTEEVKDALVRAILGKATAEDEEMLKPFRGEV